MSGNTGKMTHDELTRRGPRLRLLRVTTQHGRMLVLIRENAWPFADTAKSDFYRSSGESYVDVKTVATSYSESYLLRVAKYNRG